MIPTGSKAKRVSSVNHTTKTTHHHHHHHHHHHYHHQLILDEMLHLRVGSQYTFSVEMILDRFGHKNKF